MCVCVCVCVCVFKAFPSLFGTVAAFRLQSQSVPASTLQPESALQKANVITLSPNLKTLQWFTILRSNSLPDYVQTPWCTK